MESLLSDILIEALKESAMITFIIFLLMIIVEVFVLIFKERIIRAFSKSKFMKYFIPSLFGIIPGCTGTFVMDSVYMAGILGFGSIIAVMVATSGDEAFFILSLVAQGKLPLSTFLLLTGILFVLGIISGILADFYVKKTNLKFCEKCDIKRHPKEEFNLKHFLNEHIFKHIIKKHIVKIFLWVFGAIVVISILEGSFDVEAIFSGTSPLILIALAALIGVLPISGPNLFIVTLFSKGFLPISVLLVNSIVQDGHGLLPIMGFSFKDAIKIKLFNLVFGLLVGIILILFGL
jgi:uncharacterized membrane protein YciS (DUF1049 family)